MIIRGMNVQNKYINIKNINLDFSETGIYIVTGSNGTGKSSVFKSIIFGKYVPEFLEKEYEHLFTTHRYKLISYVPQEEPESTDSIYEFLIKKNEEIDKVNIRLFLEKFHLEKLDINQSINVLSGGEKKKLQIISALLKDTPYIVLDEPTNSLDDKATKILIDVIKNYCLNKTVIIISHDPRIFEISDKIIKFQKNNVSQVKVKPNINSNRNNTRIKTNRYGKYIWKGMQYTGQTRWMFMIYLGLGLLVLLNHFLYFSGYAVNEAPDKNQILVQSVDRVYSSLNETYAEGENIEIDPNSYFTLVNYDDINTIYELPGVQNIYLTDLSYFGNYYRDYYQNETNDYYIFSIPSIIYSSEQKISFLADKNLFYLIGGRLPEDGKKQVALSLNVMSEYFDYPSDIDTINSIGEFIEIDNEQYEIVGILVNDIVMVSFNENISYGIYKYDESTYDDFSFVQQEFLNAENAYSNVPNLLIQTFNGYERNVLNYIIINYPANNFVSNYFVLTFNNTQNRMFNNAMLITNIGISFVLGSIFYLGTKSHIKIQVGRMKDYQNYYLNKKLVAKLFFLNGIKYYLMLILFAVLVSFLLGLYTNLNSVIIKNILISYVIILFPIVLVTYKDLKNVLD